MGRKPKKKNEASYEKSKKIDKYKNLGFKYLKLGKINEKGNPVESKKNYQKSKDYFKRLISLAPNNIEAHLNLGALYLEIGKINEKEDPAKNKENYLESINHLEKVISLTYNNIKFYDNIDVYFNLGFLYLEIGKINEKEDLAKSKENYLESINHLEKVIFLTNIDSLDNIDVHLNLGTVYLKLGKINEKEDLAKGKGNYLESINHLEKVISLFPDNKKANLYLGTVYLKLGKINEKEDLAKSKENYLESINHLEKVISLTFNNTDTHQSIFLHLHLGYSYLELGEINEEEDLAKSKKNYLESINHLEKVICLAPNNIDANLYLGEVYLKLGKINEKEDLAKSKENYLESINHLEDIIFSDSDNTNAHINLGCAYLELGKINEKEDLAKSKENYLESINHLENAIFLDAYNPKVNINLGFVYLKLGEINEKEDIEKAKKNYLRSINYFNKAMSPDPNSKVAQIDLAFAYLKLGKINEKEDIEKAKKNYLESIDYSKKVLSLDFNDINAQINLGIAYQKLEILNLENGSIEERKNNYLKLINNLEKMISLSNKDIELYLNLGIAYEKLGDINEKEKEENHLKAIQKYEESIDLNDDIKEALFYLGNLLLKYLTTKKYKYESITYFKDKKNYEIKKDYTELVEKFIKYKCYFLITNLWKINSLDDKIKNYLKLEILKNLKKEFKLKIKKIKNENKYYKDIYYMYKTIDKRLMNDLNENRMWKGKPEYFNDPFDPYYKKLPTVINEELNKVRISCFTESNDNLLMWAHYGNNHKGICFGYKVEDINMDNVTFFEKVIYEELKTEIGSDNSVKLLADIDEELLTISEVYLRKHKNWNYENEWRLINLDYKENYYYNIKISEVYFGIDSALEDIRLITKILKDRPEIIFYKMRQSNNLTLDSGEIEFNKKGEVILDDNGEVKLKLKNKEDNQLEIKEK